jgi:hypothetical protein
LRATSFFFPLFRLLQCASAEGTLFAQAANIAAKIPTTLICINVADASVSTFRSITAAGSGPAVTRLALQATGPTAKANAPRGKKRERPARSISAISAGKGCGLELPQMEGCRIADDPAAQQRERTFEVHERRKISCTPNCLVCVNAITQFCTILLQRNTDANAIVVAPF